MTKNIRSSKSIVICKLPDAGLGNKLFTWAHGVIFAQENNLKHYSVGFAKLKIGPILRRESSWRFYNNYFKTSKIISRTCFFILHLRNTTVVDYSNCQSKLDLQNVRVFIFNQIPHWSDYFLNIRESRDLVIKKYFESLTEKNYVRYQSKSCPIIGIHIRMGDFKKMAECTNFAEVGQTRTPLDYFINIIKILRAIIGRDLEVTIFSDGKKSELQKILNLNNVVIAENDSDMLQMLHLSKSKIIVLSAGSTFGQWAAFFSDGAVINHYEHFHSFIRPSEFNKNSYEGVIIPGEKVDKKLLEYINNKISI